MKTRTSPRSPRSEISPSADETSSAKRDLAEGGPKAGLILCAVAVFALAAVRPAQASTYYWDCNGATSGYGTAGGTWAAPTTGDSTQGWSTSTTGELLPGSVTTATTDTTNFGNGATGLAAGTIAVSGTVSSGNMTFASGSGAIVLSGGTINLVAAATITVDNTTDTIGSVLGGAATSLTKAGTGTLTLSGANTYTGTTTISAGTLKVSGQKYLDVGRTTTIAAGAVLDLYNSNNTFTSLMPVSTINGSGTFRLSGNSTINQSTSGTNGAVRLTFAMTGGLIDLQDTSVLTNGGWQELWWTNNKASLNIATGAKLAIGDGNPMFVDALTGTGTVDRTSSWGSATLNIGVANGSGTFNGIIQETAHATWVLSLVKEGTGTQVLTGNNTYRGTTTINGGILSINTIQNVNSGTANALGKPITTANGTIGLANTGTLKYTGTGHSSNRVINLSTAAGGTMTLDASGASGTFALTGGVTSAGTSGTSTLTLTGTGLGSESAAIANGTGTNVTALTKSGAGTWTLSGTNTYSGNTTISNGTLKLTGAGSINSSPVIDVAQGAFFDVSTITYTLGASQTLKGKGTVTGPITVAGTLAPGYSTGTLTVTGNATLNGTYSVDVETGGGSDLLAVTGNLALGSGSILTIVDTGQLHLGSTYTIATYAGTLTGTFAGGTNLPGAWHVDYGPRTTSGAITVVPEPATLALMALGGVGLVLGRKRK